MEQGPDIFIDTAHNLPLQHGATVGVVGLLFALALGASLIVAVAAAWRAKTFSWVIAATGSMLAVYVAQSLISIDELRLKERGWVAIGLAMVLGVPGLALCLPVLWVTAQQKRITTLEEAESLASNPVLACERRMELVSKMANVADLKTTWSTAEAVAALDPRCPQLAPAYADLALLADDSEAGFSLADLAKRTDPLNARSWLILSVSLERQRDHDAAANALEVGNSLQRLWAIPDWDSLRQAALQ